MDWWAEKSGITNHRTAANSLHTRLRAGLNEPELLVLSEYSKLLKDSFLRPALLPQVYLHFDPQTIRQRLAADGKRLVRQRMDFLMLLPARCRVVIEIDGRQHYSTNGAPSPELYAATMREDRRLRLSGYEVYRFGGHEFADLDTAAGVVRSFFVELLARYKIT
ncbi:MAG: hypothetical protein HY997_23505 [Mycolicibacterium neoaurum]|nr:hypothetical protein [Mycolicibacterium neoaurum]